MSFFFFSLTPVKIGGFHVYTRDKVSDQSFDFIISVRRYFEINRCMQIRQAGRRASLPQDKAPRGLLLLRFRTSGAAPRSRSLLRGDGIGHDRRNNVSFFMREYLSRVCSLYDLDNAWYLQVLSIHNFRRIKKKFYYFLKHWWEIEIFI